MIITNCYRRDPQLTTRMKPIDYIGLYIIVIAASCVTVNILYRLYF